VINEISNIFKLVSQKRTINIPHTPYHHLVWLEGVNSKIYTNNNNHVIAEMRKKAYPKK